MCFVDIGNLLTVVQIEGCKGNKKNADGTTDLKHVIGCSRKKDFRSTVTITGANFGPGDNGKTIIDVCGVPCEDVEHDSDKPHEKATCKLPKGLCLMKNTFVVKTCFSLELEFLYRYSRKLEPSHNRWWCCKQRYRTSGQLICRINRTS